jgi:hypothetical protein
VTQSPTEKGGETLVSSAQIVASIGIIILVIGLAIAIAGQISPHAVVSPWSVLGIHASTRGLGIAIFVVGIIITLVGYALRRMQ